MTKFKMTCALFTAVAALSSSAFAADLKNMDDVSYTIYFETEDTSKTLAIGPGESLSDLCSDCYISVEETESGVSVSGEALVVIRDGQLFIE